MNSDRTITISKHEVVVDGVFAEDVWELAFGDDAWTKQYTDEEVLSKLREFSDKALAWDTMYEKHSPNWELDEDTEEDYEMREKMDSYLREYQGE